MSDHMHGAGSLLGMYGPPSHVQGMLPCAHLDLLHLAVAFQGLGSLLIASRDQCCDAGPSRACSCQHLQYRARESCMHALRAWRGVHAHVGGTTVHPRSPWNGNGWLSIVLV